MSKHWARYRASKIVFIAGCIFGAYASAQTFSIVNRTTIPSNGQLQLDSSMSVTYTVALTGGVNLTNVVPYLEVNSSNAAILSSFNPTWTGTTALASWTSGVSQTFTFNIHMYDNGSLCDSTAPFKLSFMSDQIASPVQATVTNPSNALQLSVASSQILRLEKLVTRLPSPALFTSPGVGSLVHSPVTSIPRSEIQDPTKRIVLYADWNFNGAPIDGVFGAFGYTLSSSSCFWDLRMLGPNYNTYHYTGTVIDATRVPEVTVNQQGQTLGVNIFDVTSAPACGTTVQNAINFNASGVFWEIAYIFQFTAGRINKLDLYIASNGSCSAAQANFGAPPDASEFHIENFYLSSTGQVKADLVVPSEWKSGNQLANGFEAKWYLRTNNRVIDLQSSSQVLSLEKSAGLTIDNPEDYFLEARVVRTQTDSTHIVSTSNSGATGQVETTLSSSNFIFQNLETGFPGPDGDLMADKTLDPGESLSFSFDVDSPTSATMPALSFVPGYELESPTRGTVVDLAFGNMVGNTSGQTHATILGSMTLVESDPLTNVNFYIDYYNAPITGSSIPFYRRYFNFRDLLGARVDLNGENAYQIQDFDFSNGTEGWTVENETQSNSLGWEYDSQNGYFAGDGGTLQSQKTDLYSLISPSMAIGNSGSVSFNHRPQFTFLQSGGLLESRIVENGTPGSWFNFILAAGDCSPTCVVYDGIFPSSYNTGNYTAYLTNQPVWMLAEAAQTTDVDLPSSIFLHEGKEIQFRFVFQDPSLSVNGSKNKASLTHWEVNNFTYQGQVYQGDNLFGVNLDSLNWDCRDSKTLEIAGEVPVNQIGVEWYESRAALLTGGQSPVLGAVTLPFNPVDPGTYSYYARLSNDATKRVVKVTLTVDSGCACFETLQDAVDAVYESIANWPSAATLLGFVEQLNSICL